MRWVTVISKSQLYSILLYLSVLYILIKATAILPTYEASFFFPRCSKKISIQIAASAQNVFSEMKASRWIGENARDYRRRSGSSWRTGESGERRIGNGGKKKKKGHSEVLEGPQKSKGQSLVKRPSKHPQGSIANHILTVDGRRGRPGKCQRRRFHDERRRRGGPPCPLLQRDNMWPQTNDMAAIGGANAHSRPDRLSFVTSFTLSNDTHCFWTPSSYANRAPGTDSLYYSPFLCRPPTSLPSPFVCSLAPFSSPVSILVTLARSISSSFHRARGLFGSRTWHCDG